MKYHLAVFYHAASLFLPRLVAGLITFFIMLSIAFIVQWCVRRIGRKTKRNPYLFDIFATSAKSIIIIVGIIMGLGTVGINVAALVTSLGLAGFALGLAIKDPLSNMIAGVMLLYYQPFKVGDEVDVGGKNAGKVVAVSLRYTRLVSEDTEMLVPNNTVLAAVLTVKKQSI